jgi:hypothetical protein
MAHSIVCAVVGNTRESLQYRDQSDAPSTIMVASGSGFAEHDTGAAQAHSTSPVTEKRYVLYVARLDETTTPFFSLPTTIA